MNNDTVDSAGKRPLQENELVQQLTRGISSADERRFLKKFPARPIKHGRLGQNSVCKLLQQ